MAEATGVMAAADFEPLYRADPDPWGYTSSAYERAKYDATLEASGPGPFTRALELGGSIGVFSSRLAPRCDQLVTIDASATAVAAAQARLGGRANVAVIEGSIPEDIPNSGFDLVVASEILYYLSDARLTATLAALQARLLPGGRMVAVHWRPEGPERAQSAAQVHDALLAQPWLRPVSSTGTADYLLDVLERP
jgi:cyclopropane fatty-acyl-phospholipid synthase-like methyltransferase